ncbi:MAG: type II toxin-antitoxin system VapB family antitoxin [Dehalococcoidia bacterium]|nr:type II toxin-antitoxin system VapB family antitoxin [Dehalococcoidia bacterium]
MKRTTIVADEELLLEVKQIASEENHSVSDVIQEALREYVKSKRQSKCGRISFVGAGRSNRADISEKAEEILEEDIRQTGGWG